MHPQSTLPLTRLQNYNFLPFVPGPGRINIGYRRTSYESPLYGEMFFSDGSSLQHILSEGNNSCNLVTKGNTRLFFVFKIKMVTQNYYNNSIKKN